MTVLLPILRSLKAEGATSQIDLRMPYVFRFLLLIFSLGHRSSSGLFGAGVDRLLAMDRRCTRRSAPRSMDPERPRPGNTSLTVSSRGNVAEEWIAKFAHLVERRHEHVGRVMVRVRRGTSTAFPKFESYQRTGANGRFPHDRPLSYDRFQGIDVLVCFLWPLSSQAWMSASHV